MRILVLLVLAVNAAMAADIPLRPANGIYTLVEGNSYSILEANGNPVTNMVLGSLGLCDPGPVGNRGTCDVNTPALPGESNGMLDQSDIAIWEIIFDPTGKDIGTRLLFCSDALPADDGRDVAVTGQGRDQKGATCGQGTYSWTNLPTTYTSAVFLQQ